METKNMIIDEFDRSPLRFCLNQIMYIALASMFGIFGLAFLDEFSNGGGPQPIFIIISIIMFIRLLIQYKKLPKKIVLYAEGLEVQGIYYDWNSFSGVIFTVERRMWSFVKTIYLGYDSRTLTIFRSFYSDGEYMRLKIAQLAEKKCLNNLVNDLKLPTI